MISTGNDIVALAATDQDRTCRYRFYSRMLTPAEISLYDRVSAMSDHVSAMSDHARSRVDTALSFSSFVWLMWSIKESVYKYVSRSNPQLVFAPLKIPVSGLSIREDYYEGIICSGGLTLYSRSFLLDGAIMTVVSEERDFTLTCWGIRTIEDPACSSQSANVRAFALESLSAVFPGVALRIVKTPDGPPEVWDGQQMLDIPLSLAHHDRFVAWSYRLNNSSYRKSAAN